MAAQELDADGVEGAEPGHALDHLADEHADALLHLARRLVGEGDGEDLGRVGAAGREDMGDAGGQHPRLAGARTRQHQHRAVHGLDGAALLGIEAGEIGALRARRFARRHGARGDAARRADALSRRCLARRWRCVRLLVEEGNIVKTVGHAA